MEHVSYLKKKKEGGTHNGELGQDSAVADQLVTG
jgi:hypothetical protein